VPTQPLAKFKITSLDIKPTEINAGEKASISAQVVNTGSVEGVYSAILFVDSEKIGEKDITVAPGSTQTVTFPISKDTAGVYKVGIGDNEIGIGEKSATLTVNPKLIAKQIELKYDNGLAKDCLSLVKPATGYLVSFVSPPNPFTVSNVRVFGLVYGSPGYRIGPSDLQIWDKDGKVLYTTPFPGNQFPLRTRLGDNLDSTGTWVDVEIPNVKVEGNFYINIYTGIATGQGFRLGAEDIGQNTHCNVTIRGDNGADSIATSWPYSIAYWYGAKSSVHWMLRVVGNVMIPQD
jgi:hypothetical protein